LEDEVEAAAIHLQETAFTSGHAATPPPAQNEPEKTSPAPAPKNAAAVETLIGRTIADVERDMILNTLDHCLGNRTHAANILGISIRTLRNKLTQYKDEGIDIPQASAGGG